MHFLLKNAWILETTTRVRDGPVKMSLGGIIFVGVGKSIYRILRSTRI